METNLNNFSRNIKKLRDTRKKFHKYYSRIILIIIIKFSKQNFPISHQKILLINNEKHNIKRNVRLLKVVLLA